VVYGQNPNSGTTSMIGALALAREIKNADVDTKICFVGSHTSALPMEVLSEDAVDIVLLNEGVYALINLLKSIIKLYLFEYLLVNIFDVSSPRIPTPQYVFVLSLLIPTVCDINRIIGLLSNLDSILYIILILVYYDFYAVSAGDIL
jgi:hypothetical protein